MKTTKYVQRLKMAFMSMLLLVGSMAQAENCSNRGVLDKRFCDENHDMVADAPKDPKNYKNPSTLVFTYTPVEDPAVYKDAFSDFQAYLSKVTGKKVIYYTVHSNAAEVEALRSGRLHIAGFSPGPTGYAVNLGGYVPIAVKGTSEGFQGYNLIVITRKDSSIKNISDIKGRIVAHTSISSNSGNLAPRALFPKLGVTPGLDYKVKYSGKHDQSIIGVATGDYDAAPVASDVFNRMSLKGTINKEDFRILFTSPLFPTSSFGYSSELEPKLAKKIEEAFSSYRFTPEMTKIFGGVDRFSPISYKKDWQVIRDIAHSTGVAYSDSGLKELAKRDAAKRAKKAAAAKKKN